jgi:hypothetical protein
VLSGVEQQLAADGQYLQQTVLSLIDHDAPPEEQPKPKPQPLTLPSISKPTVPPPRRPMAGQVIHLTASQGSLGADVESPERLRGLSSSVSLSAI